MATPANDVCVDCVQNESSNSQPVQLDTAPATNASDLVVEFAPPPLLPSFSVSIEFCNRCRWLHRASWVSTELFLTFPPPTIKGIHLIPLDSPETGGRFRVWLSTENGQVLLWDRKTEGGFPELKVLKQRLRDRVQPTMGLGHSDGASKPSN